MKKPAYVLGLATLASLAVAGPAIAAPTGTATPTAPVTAQPSAPAPSATPTTAPATPSATPSSTASATATATATASATAEATSADAAAAASAITAAAQRLGYGDATGTMQTVSGGYAQTFKGGTVYYSLATGAKGLQGGIAAKYAASAALQSKLGLPTSDIYTIGDGEWGANFQYGQILWTTRYGGYAVQGSIGASYAAMGSYRSVLGFPISDETPGTVPGSYVARFANGTITWSPTTGARAVYNGNGSRYRDLGTDGSPLGLVTTNEYQDGAGAWVNDFQRGQIIWTSGTGSRAVYNGNYGVYAALGGTTGVLGIPTSDEMDGGRNSRVNRFANGTIVWSQSTGSHAVYNGNYGLYRAMGSESSPLGLPTSEEYSSGNNSRVNAFSNGTIVWSPTTGSHAVYNGNYGVYAALGAQNGALGLPTTDEFAGGGNSRVNRFTQGTIVWSQSTGSQAVYGGIYEVYRAMGSEGGSLGKPTTSEMQGAGNRRYNRFENGIIMWSPTTGAHPVAGAILNKWASQNYEAGSLGAPTSDQYNVPGGVEQRFEGGTLTYVNGSFGGAQDPLKTSANAVGNYYYGGSCVWYAYNRRVQLGAPVGSFWGNGGVWASSARVEGFRVDHTPQVGAVISTYGFGSDPVYGHAMVVESINADGSFTVSQMNAPVAYQVSYRTFSAGDAAGLWFIH